MIVKKIWLAEGSTMRVFGEKNFTVAIISTGKFEVKEAATSWLRGFAS